MFFILSKVLTVLIDPAFIVFCAFLAFGVHSAKAGGRRAFFVLPLLFLYCISTPILVDPLFARLEGKQALSSAQKQHYDAVVVLTGMVSLSLSRENEEEFGGAVDRILRGIDMVRQNKVDLLVISGGSGELMGPTQSESKILQKFAIRFGLPREKILIDATSRNTRENALMSKALLEAYQLKNIALITSAFHMTRALGCFKAVGLAPAPIPVDYQVAPPNSKDFRNYFPRAETMALFGTLLHETVGIITYGLRGYAVYW